MKSYLVFTIYFPFCFYYIFFLSVFTIYFPFCLGDNSTNQSRQTTVGGPQSAGHSRRATVGGPQSAENAYCGTDRHTAGGLIAPVYRSMSQYVGKPGHVQCETTFTDGTRCNNCVHTRRPLPRHCDDCLEQSREMEAQDKQAKTPTQVPTARVPG